MSNSDKRDSVASLTLSQAEAILDRHRALFEKDNSDIVSLSVAERTHDGVDQLCIVIGVSSENAVCAVSELVQSSRASLPDYPVVVEHAELVAVGGDFSLGDEVNVVDAFERNMSSVWVDGLVPRILGFFRATFNRA